MLIFVEHGTRRLHIGGVTPHPTGPWVSQQARNLAVDLGTRIDTLRFLIRDRDAKFGAGFDAVFQAADLEIITTPPQAPRANAICERLVGTLRHELLDRTLVVGEQHLRRVLDEYAEHYNDHRPHQALDQHPPAADQVPRPPVIPPTTSADPPSWAARSTSTTTPREHPGQPSDRVSSGTGLINEYHAA